MNTVLDAKKIATSLQPFHRQQKTLVLTGGCFDLLHVGHIAFLKAAKEQGDILIVLLENDEMIKKRKGNDRPFETQITRAKHLISQDSVDLVILLPQHMTDTDYDNLVSEIKPAIIATTKGDPYRHHKERQAKQSNARVVNVTKRIPGYATSRLTKQL